MTKVRQFTRNNWGLVILAVIVIFTAVFFYQSNSAFSSAPSGLYSTLATTSTRVVGKENPVKIFSTSQNCSSRIITTYAQPITLAFSTSSLSAVSTSTPDTGHYQAASTTIAYDSGIYGCDEWLAYGYNASTTLSLSEFR